MIGNIDIKKNMGNRIEICLLNNCFKKKRNKGSKKKKNKKNCIHSTFPWRKYFHYTFKKKQFPCNSR